MDVFLMRIFYILTFILGVFTLLAAPDVRSELPHDMVVATELLQSPTNWMISLDSSLTQRLIRHDVKICLITALKKRCNSEFNDNKWIVVMGIGTILFSIIGLIREKKFALTAKI